MQRRILVFGVVCAAAGSLCAQGPSNAPANLPKAEDLLRQVMAQALKDEAGERAFAQAYSYLRTRVTENRDSKGKLQSREEKKDVRKPAPLASSPPMPPPAAPRRPAPSPMKGSESLMAPRSTTAPRGRTFDRSDFILNGDLLNRFVFKVTRRELINGRSSLILEFQPSVRQPSAKSLKDRFINKAAGQLWIDEEESILMRAKLHLTQPVDVVGGLVASISTFNYEFDRERTGEGFWFTRTTQWHLEGREVVLHKNVDYSEVKSDLRKISAGN